MQHRPTLKQNRKRNMQYTVNVIGNKAHIELPLDRFAAFLTVLTMAMDIHDTDGKKSPVPTFGKVSKAGKRLGRPPKAKVQAVAA
jgi:hypothetical protein